MTLKVIELNDKAIKVGDESGILLRSPGFVLADGKTVLLGEEAEKQARLKPTSAFNKYWQELSLEPFRQHEKFRHYADFAHAHLIHVAEQAQLDHDVIFAVPGSFTRQQIAILLGLARHSPLRPVGVVDSALAMAVATASTAETIIHADIQLHQVVLTRLRRKGDLLQSDSVIQVPGVGSQHFMDLMMKLATGLFIQQSRFNPQHNAESEQQLYNALPGWLAQDEKEGNLILELSSGGSLYTAKWPRQSLVSSLGGHYRRIAQQLAALAAADPAQLLLSEELAALPGLQATLADYPNLLVVDSQSGLAGCLERSDLIISGEEAVHRVTALPLAPAAPARAESAPLPTHALFRDHAFALPGLEIRNQESLNGHSAAAAGLVLAIAGLQDRLGRIEKADDGLYYFQGEAAHFFVNDEQCQGRQALALGDRLRFPGSEESIRLIRVSDE